MGFTFSHPALIFPFRLLPRKIYSLNGLIVGSMIPDLEYFIRFDNKSTFSHSVKGLFLFDLPCGILILILFHQLIRNLLINNLPNFLKVRLNRFKQVNWLSYLKKNWIVVVYSIFIGELTYFISLYTNTSLPATFNFVSIRVLPFTKYPPNEVKLSQNICVSAPMKME